MAVETVYPMNQAIVGGTLFASGYLFHLIFIGMKYVVRRRVVLKDYKHQVCHKGGVEEIIDYTTLPCLIGLVLIIGAILMLVCLQVKTQRRDYETNAKLMKISVFSIENPTFSGNFPRSIES
uniref:Uncharacterized protein n=1 Tax=Acrobeloides nanus TaxID=290746 RepID=A0A914DUP8_9BILA